MPKYRVSMQEVAFYSVYVEADDEAQAEALAEAKFCKGEYSHDSWSDRHVTDVELETESRQYGKKD